MAGARTADVELPRRDLKEEAGLGKGLVAPARHRLVGANGARVEVTAAHLNQGSGGKQGRQRKWCPQCDPVRNGERSAELEREPYLDKMALWRPRLAVVVETPASQRAAKVEVRAHLEGAGVVEARGHGSAVQVHVKVFR